MASLNLFQCLTQLDLQGSNAIGRLGGNCLQLFAQHFILLLELLTHTPVLQLVIICPLLQEIQLLTQLHTPYLFLPQLLSNIIVFLDLLDETTFKVFKLSSHSLRVLLDLVQIYLIFILHIFSLLQFVPQISNDVLKAAYLIIFVNLFPYYFFLFLEDIVIEDPEVFQFILLIAQHSLIFLFQFPHSPELYLYLTIALLTLLQLPLYDPEFIVKSGPFLLKLSNPQILLVVLFFFKDKYLVDIHHFNLQLMHPFLYMLDLIHLVIQFILQLPLLRHQLVTLPLVLFSQSVQLQSQTLHSKLQLIFTRLQQLTLSLIMLQLHLQLFNMHMSLNLMLPLLTPLTSQTLLQPLYQIQLLPQLSSTGLLIPLHLTSHHQQIPLQRFNSFIQPNSLTLRLSTSIVDHTHKIATEISNSPPLRGSLELRRSKQRCFDSFRFIHRKSLDYLSKGVLKCLRH